CSTSGLCPREGQWQEANVLPCECRGGRGRTQQESGGPVARGLATDSGGRRRPDREGGLLYPTGSSPPSRSGLRRHLPRDLSGRSRGNCRRIFLDDRPLSLL